MGHLHLGVIKLDGVGYVDNRPATDKLQLIARKKEEEEKKKKIVTHDM